MNLGQAVAVCCYELSKHSIATDRLDQQKAPPASLGEVTRLVNEAEKLLASANRPATGPEKKRQVRLRQMLLRWSVSSEEVTALLGVLRDLSRQMGSNAGPHKD